MKNWRLYETMNRLEPISPSEVAMIPWMTTRVAALPGRQLEVTFADGLHGVVDLSGECFAGALAPLNDPDFFALANVKDGAVSWPGDMELAPDAMHVEVKRQPLNSGRSERTGKKKKAISSQKSNASRFL